MSMKQKLYAMFTHIKENPLGRKVLSSILICSTVLALLATSVQLLFDYKHDVSIIESRMSEIERSHVGSIAASMWSMDDMQITKQLEGLANLPDVNLVKLYDPNGKLIAKIGDEQKAMQKILRKMPVIYQENQENQENHASTVLGNLEIEVSLDRIYEDLRNKTLVILAAQATKTTLVAIFSLFIFNLLVSRHLSALAVYAKKLTLGNVREPLRLTRKQPKKPDELDVVVTAMNQMNESIQKDYEEIAHYKQSLEILVSHRTNELAEKIQEKEMAIQKLNHEIKERKQVEELIKENEERYRQVVEMSPDAIIIEVRGKITFANSSSSQLFGLNSTEEILGRPLSDFFIDEQKQQLQEHQETLLQKSAVSRMFESSIVREDGSSVKVEISQSVFHLNGSPAIQSVIHDITHHKDYEENLKKIAMYDGLTGLPNRTMLLEKLAQAICIAEAAQKKLYILFFDLDRFKYVNDTLGHDAGDELLKIITMRMGQVIRRGDTLARLGGDEFVMLIENQLSEQELKILCDRLMSVISQPIMLDKQEVVITSSIGLSIYPQDGKDSVSLLKFADTAMYHAKELGRNSIQRYNVDMQQRVNEHLMLESHLRHALERNQLSLQYQPLLSLRTRKIIGAEALIRWYHPELGMISPIKFIPIAEETGLINSIGAWVVKTACQQMRTWLDQGFEHFRMSVNLSAKQLVNDQIEQEIFSAITETRLPKNVLALEITESMSMNDPERMVGLLKRFKELGTCVAIDDFGTGYSNLAYLNRFPISHLKLDRSFVRDIEVDPDDACLAQSIIALAHSMKLSVVAEGVETIAQLMQLEGFNCDEMQGYLLSKPLTPQDFEILYRSNYQEKLHGEALASVV